MSEYDGIFDGAAANVERLNGTRDGGHGTGEWDRDGDVGMQWRCVARGASGLHIGARRGWAAVRTFVTRSMTTMPRSAALLAAVLAVSACGDADTNDARGYTKAPLENPGWTIEAEEPSEMAELGDPIRVPSMDTLSEETGAPAQPATNPQTTNPQPGTATPGAATPAAAPPQ